VTATDRARRQSATDHAGRPARIEAVTRDLRADVEHEGHKIIEMHRYASSTMQRFCETCRREIEPRKEEP
jgi:hypothetical protein